MEFILIMGCDRSGTTVLGRKIAEFGNRTLLFPEAQWLGAFTKLLCSGVKIEKAIPHLLNSKYLKPWTSVGIDLKKIFQEALGNNKFCVNRNKKFIENVFYLASIQTEQCHSRNEFNSKVIIEHTPWNADYYLYMVNYLKIRNLVHVIRDGRDVAVSLLDRKWGPNTFYTASVYWSNKLLTTEQIVSKRKKGITIKYEDFVQYEENDIRDFLNKMSLPFKRENSAKNLIAQGQYKEQHKNITQPLNSKSVKKWKDSMSKKQLNSFYLCLESNGLLKKYRYSETLKISKWTRSKHLKFTIIDKILKFRNLI